VKTIKAADATNIQLDWLVAKAKSLHVRFWESPTLVEILHPNLDWISFKPSTNWSQGGPIIEREGIELMCNLTATEAKMFKDAHADWQAFYRKRRAADQRSHAVLPLMAAMRCFVVSKLGETVEIPKELT
jgi:hypothetical protein